MRSIPAFQYVQVAFATSELVSTAFRTIHPLGSGSDQTHEAPMPMLIKTVDEVMAQERRDMLFIQFWQPLRRREEKNKWRQKHLEWFDANGLRYEKAAPRGWLEGDPGIFAVYFDGPSDPRIEEYSKLFENLDGKILAPDEYRMVIAQYEAWLEGARERERHNFDD